MRRAPLAALAALAACGLGAGSARASGDYSAPTVYSLIQSDTDNNVPFLAPSNESRVTLMLLLSDAGLARPRLPAKSDTLSVNAYFGQTPLSLDVVAAILGGDPEPAAGDGTSEFTEGQGDVCRSNAAGSSQFLTALGASAAPAPEQALLTNARKALASGCSSSAKPAIDLPAGSIRSAPGKDFATYLGAAAAFYAGDFAQARRGFAGLANSRQPWLKEAARYMTARADLNQAQQNAFGEYGELTLKNVDASALATAESGFRAYLHDYPRGAYAPSAHGLLRRVAWLGGDHAKLAAEFGQAFGLTDPAMRNVSAADLAYEADNKLLGKAEPAEIHEPRLLTTLDLMLMRREPGKAASLTREALEAQRPDFASRKDLFDYLLAAYAFYDEDNPGAALKLLDHVAAGPRMTSVQFSQQVLKGLALEATGDPAGARSHWLALVPLAEPVLQRPAVELALAQNYERSGEVAAVFAPASPIQDPTYRELLLTNSAGPALLRQRATSVGAAAHERQLALYVLLFKQLTRSRYQAFLDDLRLAPATGPGSKQSEYDKLGRDGEMSPALTDFDWAGGKDSDNFACPSLRVIVTALAHDPRDERSLICLGEFLRLKGYDGFLRGDHPAVVPNAPPPPKELGAVAAQFPGVGISRLDIYKQIIADPKASKEVRAYALYRAVNCWAPSAYNSCDNTDVPKSQRKQWFQQLKTRYANTAWADMLKYYW